MSALFCDQLKYELSYLGKGEARYGGQPAVSANGHNGEGRRRHGGSTGSRNFKYSSPCHWEAQEMPGQLSLSYERKSLVVGKCSITHSFKKMYYPDNGILFSTKKKWAIKPWKAMAESSMRITKWKANLKRLHAVGFHLYDMLERLDYGDNEKISSRQGVGAEAGVMNRWNPEDF